MAHKYFRLFNQTNCCRWVRENIWRQQRTKKVCISVKMQRNLTENQTNKTDFMSDVSSRIQSLELKAPWWVYKEWLSMLIIFSKQWS